MADQSPIPPSLLKQLEDWKAAKEKAEAETQTVRTKLHSAVRKGKAIEAERASLALKLDRLATSRTQVRV